MAETNAAPAVQQNQTARAGRAEKGIWRK
jgi:hypothetical protein